MPTAIFVSYDGSRRSRQALVCAIELCRDTRALLGIAVIRPHVVGFGWPGSCTAAFVSEQTVCREALALVPDDVSVRFLAHSHPVGIRDIAEFARRLGCESVILPDRRFGARRAARLLGRAGLALLVEPSAARTRQRRWLRFMPSPTPPARRPLSRAEPVPLSEPGARGS